MKCEAIYEKRNEYGISEMCKTLGLSASTYYKWIKRKESNKHRAEEKRRLAAKVRNIFEINRKVYGYRKMQRALEEEKIVLSVYRIRRIMRENGLYPEIARKFKPYPNRKSDGRYSENILEQKFDVKQQNKVWAGDITYIRTSIGWVYLSIVMDLYNREIIGYSVSKSVDTELVKRALGNALPRKDTEGNLLFHSDRGCQYSSKLYNRMMIDNGIVGSMSRAGCPYDNSCVECFFATLKKECIYGRKYSTMEEVERDLFEYIELFYNRKRLHSTLGYLSPVKYRMQNGDGKAA